MVIITPPQEGTIVEVRRRRYVVVDVAPSQLSSPLQTAMHLVTLSSIEDEGFAEELEVIWELEPGAKLSSDIPPPTPDGFDDPRRLEAFLDAVRWGTTSTADTRSVLAPFRSGVEIEDYQLDPLVRAIQMPRVNLLIADDVGLGKTIEAGLVAQELLLRHRARTVLIICPAPLQIQWRDQMREKFGLSFHIVDTPFMRELRRTRGLHVNPWEHFPRLITSIDFIKRERPMRLMNEALPADDQPTYPRRFDLLIVDEAHNVAPSGRGHYALDSQRTQTIRRLVPHFEHKLFLSATPHNGYQESFTALLELLDNQRFVRGVQPRKEQLGVVMVRRLKSELPKRWDGSPRFAERRLAYIKVTYTAKEKHIHHLLRAYGLSRLQHAHSEVERLATEFVLKLLKKRLFSSPLAFLRTLQCHKRSLQQATQRERVHPPTVSILRQQLEQVEIDFDDEDAYDEATEVTINQATRLFREPSADEHIMLAEMIAWAEDASLHEESKTRELIAWLDREIRPNGVWSDERVIIFTEYRDTQKWLHGVLAEHHYTKQGRVKLLYGGMVTDDREAIKAAFQSDPALDPVRILLATDAASEGIDLQNHCSRLIHFEIPWNPNRMEQRNGRVDRHGQRAPVVAIFHFVGASFQERTTPAWEVASFDLEDDLEFLMRTAIKVNQIREDLGSVGPVIAAQVEEAMVGKRRRLDTLASEEKGRAVKDLLKFERDLDKRIKQVMEAYTATRQALHLEPEHIAEVVAIALEYADQPPLIATEEAGVYRVPALKGSWASCLDGLAHPHTRVQRPITFDERISQGRDDLVLAHLNHRLVSLALRLLRNEIWSSSRQQLHRVTSRQVSHLVLRDPAVVMHGRLMVLGGDQQRLHEEVLVAAGYLREGKFVRMQPSDLDRLLHAATLTPASAALQDRLAALWPNHSEAARMALDHCADQRFGTLQEELQRQETTELAKIHAILTELQESIRRELTGPTGTVQLQLDFTPEERDQVRHNHDFLQDRLVQIPQELARETAAIRRRFTDIQQRVFPLAITFLVPDHL